MDDDTIKGLDDPAQALYELRKIACNTRPKPDYTVDELVARIRAGYAAQEDAVKQRLMRLYSAEIHRREAFIYGSVCPFCGAEKIKCACEPTPIIKKVDLLTDDRNWVSK